MSTSTASASLMFMPGHLGHLGGEVALGVDRVDQQIEAGGLEGGEVGLSEGRGDVDQAGALVGGRLG